MIDYYLKVLKQYVDFSGRARRKEYWYFALCHMIIIYGIILIAGLLANSSSTVAGILSVVIGIYYLGTFLPVLAVGVRRMHDVGKSGWFLIIPIYNIILAVTEGQSGPNEYGHDPKAAERKGVTTETF